MNKKTPNLRLLDKTEEKDHTSKPVMRGPLPEKDQITLCELVTWLAIGKAWPARRLKGLMKRNRGQRRPAFLWDSFEREAANVVSLCRQGELSPNGSVDGNPHEPFSKDYFLSDVYADYVSDSIGPDPLAWQNESYPEGLPTYRSVRFLRSDLLSTAETAQAPAGGAQDDAALALEMVSARETDRLKPAISAVPPLDSVNLTLDDTLSLKEIFNLAMGNDPKAANPADSREYDAISRAARQGRLKATKDGRRPRFWLVYKDDLGQFLSTADKHWAWLRQFYKRWMSARGEEPLAPSIMAANDTDRPERKPVSNTELEKWYGRYITQRQVAGIIPRQQADYEAAREYFKDSIVSRNRVRKLRHRIAPEEWQTDKSGPKPKQTAG